MKDIVVHERFTFAPNFRKALALHWNTASVTDAEIRAWISVTVDRAAEQLEHAYYDARQTSQEGA